MTDGFYDDSGDLDTTVFTEGRPELTYDKAAVDAIRNSWEYKNQRANFRATCANMKVPLPDGSISNGAPCWLCGGAIDYRLKWPHPESWSLEHIKTVKEAPELILDMTNWASAHLDCNQRRGTDEAFLDIGEPSEIW